MKKLIITLFAFVVCLQVFPQRLNEHGLKVVKEIKFTSYENFGKTVQGSSKYVFKYDEDLKLVYMSCEDGHEVYEMVGKGKLKRTTNYDNPSEAIFNYHFNPYGLIDKIEYLYYGEIKCRYNFEYDYIEELGRFHLKRWTGIEWHVSKKDGKCYKQGDRDESFVYDNGYVTGIICPYSNEDYIKRMKRNARYEQDSTRVNDTNINLSGLLWVSTLGDSYISNLCLTEWLPRRHEYLPFGGSCGCKYFYDSKCNIVKIQRFICGYLRFEFDITYLE